MNNAINRMEIHKIEEFIKTLNQEELTYMNRLIVSRLKLLSQSRSSDAMTKFNIGDQVEFSLPTGEIKVGIILRLNIKTVSLRTIDGIQWKVSPHLLKVVKT